jgi:hypothetical protein
MFSEYLLRLPPDTPCRGGPACHHVHHSLRLFLLRKNVVRAKEHWGHIPMLYVVLFRRANRVQPRGLCRWHHCEFPIEQQSIADLQETFNNLRRFNIKWNPEKCTFGVPLGKLLEYIMTDRGIKANPDKISAIAEMGQVRNVKGIQRLMGCLMALSCFVSRLGERGLPPYKLLKSHIPSAGQMRHRRRLMTSRHSSPNLQSWPPQSPVIPSSCMSWQPPKSSTPPW